MQEQVYHTPIHDVDDIKQRLLDVWPVWEARDQRIIDNAAFQCPQRKEDSLNIFFN